MIVLTKINTDRYGNERNGNAAVAVNESAIRCFYARHDNRPGTRLTFTDGGGFAVSESPDEVARKLASQFTEADISALTPPAAPPVSAAAATVVPLTGANAPNDDVD